MNRKIVVGTIVTLAALAAGAFGFVAYRSASAAGALASRIQQSVPLAGAPGGRGGMRGGYTQEDLAAALGITVEELQAAYQKANAAALQQAVEEGLVTQAQADAMRARGGAFPFGGRMNGWLAEKGIDFEALLAEALGISVPELQAAHQQAAGAALQRAIDEGRITQEQADLMQAKQALFGSEVFQAAMQDAFKDAVQAAVEAGVITQAQADLVLSNLDSGAPGFPGMPGMDGPHGGHPGHGGEFPGFPGEPPAAPSDNG